MSVNHLSSVAILALLFFEANAQQSGPAWINEGPYVDEGNFAFELPLEFFANKLYVNVEMGGEPRRFVFDTGSPSMISAELAAELGLKRVDSAQGADAHGAIVQSDIVQADLKLGDVVFRQVPTFVADFSRSVAAQCLIGDGVLGSELLPLCAWQVDLPESVLRCDTDVSNLDHVEGAQREHLYDFGYPHTPYVDVRFAEGAESKAMFDTGSPGYLTVSTPDFEGAKRAGGIGSVLAGYGSPGGSLGGQAPDDDQHLAEVRSLSVGDIALGLVDAPVRELAPSLIGASLLKHFIVTLVSGSDSIFFERYNALPFERGSFGFSLGFNNAISVSMVWDHSLAAKAGLKAGLELNSINGMETNFSCTGIRSALEAMAGESIEITWNDGTAELTRD